MKSEKVLSISAIVIAIASIIVTIWEGVEVRQHNRLSVRPKFEIYFNPDLEKNSMSWIIFNNGIGPGFYKYSKVYIDTTEYNLNYSSTFKKITEILDTTGIFISGRSSFNPGLTVKSGDLKRILSLDFKNKEIPTEEFWKLHNRFRFEIGYESMYNELFICKYPMNSD